jgi:hypothetical protein
MGRWWRYVLMLLLAPVGIAIGAEHLGRRARTAFALTALGTWALAMVARYLAVPEGANGDAELLFYLVIFPMLTIPAAMILAVRTTRQGSRWPQALAGAVGGFMLGTAILLAIPPIDAPDWAVVALVLAGPTSWASATAVVAASVA